MTGYDNDELVGKTLAVLRGPKTEPIAAERIEKDLQTLVCVRYHTISYRKNHRQFMMEWQIKRLPELSESVPHYLICMRDITEQNCLREQMQQAQKMEAVGRLAGGLAHDFNNLLTVILGYAGLLSLELAKDAPPDCKQLRSLNEIQLASEKAAALTGQLLTFSRKQVLRARAVEVNRVISGIAGMLRRLLGEDVDLELALSPALGTVQADPGQLEQVLMNMAVNARDAMPKGGMLTIQTRNTEITSCYSPATSLEPGQYVMLSISDTGIGMDDETRAHVFEPFFTTKEPGRGTGLGLSMVYSFVKQNDGAIELTSQPGMGACFNIYLPRVDLVPDPLEIAEIVSYSRGSGVVLVVEDDAGIRELVREMLDEAGYEVYTASHASQALNFVTTHSLTVDLLLTDVVLPGVSGIDLAETLKSMQPRMRILFASGYSDHALLRHGSLDRAATFISKPFSARALLSVVGEMMTARAATQAP